MQAVVVTFDRLAMRLLGCYGNEWIETPNLDRFATAATLFDHHFTDSVGPRAGLSWLTGQHAMRPAAASAVAGIGDRLRLAGISSHLMVADNAVSIPWQSGGFDQTDHVKAKEGLEAAPANVPIAKLVQAGQALLKQPASSPRLLWLHCSELKLPPEGFASLYFEDFEERGIQLAEMPQSEWPEQIAVAAGAMSLVDHWLGELLSQIQAMSADQPTLVIIAAARGRSWMNEFVAATPSVRGHSPAAVLRDQETQSPLFVAVIGGDRHAELAGIRSPRLVQSLDLVPTILDWFGIPMEAKEFEGRSLLEEAVSLAPSRPAVLVGDDQNDFGIRTLDWNCLIRTATGATPTLDDVRFGDGKWPEAVQLFSKPDDIWDVTDLATQLPEDCESLVRAINFYRCGQEPILQPLASPASSSQAE